MTIASNGIGLVELPLKELAQAATTRARSASSAASFCQRASCSRSAARRLCSIATATNFPRDLVKLCTAHDKRTKTDRAYQRSDLLEKRREIMKRWLDFVTRARS